MIPPAPTSTSTYTLVPYTPRFRSPLVSHTGTHVIWEGPKIPVVGYLDVTSEEVAAAAIQALRLAAVGLAFAAYALLLDLRSEEHTSELQSLMRSSYAVFCLKQKKSRISRHYRSWYYQQQ